MPPAEVEIGDELVRTLLRDQAPRLASLPVRPFANGWDNVLFRLGDELLVRLPRRAAAARLVEHEQRWLPGLAPRLPVPVPVPVVAGRPAAGYPWAWSVVPHLPGTIAADAVVDGPEAATALGAFLGRLHRRGAPDAPANPVRGVPLADREPAFRANLATLADFVDRHGLTEIWSTASAAGRWAAAPVWLHGDLHPANILVQDARISAVIDFGDVTAGDPATDLAVAWMLLGAHDRGTFWRGYAEHARHPVDDALHRRAHGWAALFATTYLARSADNPTMHAIGMRTLRAVLAT